MAIRKATLEDYDEIMAIWESSVQTGPNALSKKEVAYFKTIIPDTYLPLLDVYIVDEEGPKAFIGITESNIELLYVAFEARSRGYAKGLVDFVVRECSVTKVDVRDNDPDAVALYKHLGFEEVGRDVISGGDTAGYMLHLALRG